MSVIIYRDPRTLPREIDRLLKFDVSSCELRVTCQAHQGGQSTAIGGYLGSDVDGVDQPRYTPVVVLRTSYLEDVPTLCCEDCAAWLCEVTGGTIHER